MVAIANATIINVPGDQPTIQAGINIAVNGDTILVQPGSYVENINFNGKNIVVGSLFLTTGDTAYISQTVIDGDSSGSVVTFENSEDTTAVLRGFTITNGSYGSGGGIYCLNSSPRLVNVTMIGNSADEYGGGIFCSDESSPSLENVTISGNTADDGGGIYCYESSPSLINVTVSGNTSSSYGGGICCIVNSNLSFVNVTITNNYAYSGGGIWCVESSPSLENVTIIVNSAINGGGIFCDVNSSPSLDNVTISGNTAVYSGGGIYCRNNSIPSLSNVTISENTAHIGGGIYCHDNSNPTLINTVLWNDLSQEIYFCQYGDSSSITIAYSDVQGGQDSIVTNDNGTVNWLEGNIDTDPLFVDATSGDFHHQEGSPCIDAGIPDTSGLNLPLWDLDGNQRIWDGDGDGSAIIDMGAYEYGSPSVVGIDDNAMVELISFNLYQNYPNPFNHMSTIKYGFPKESKVTLKIFDILGREVTTLVNEHQTAGYYQVSWDASGYSSGIYFYQIQAGEFRKVRKMVLLK
ncbi:T9SS type A sorting domain-containing protein [candidate division KSB1 bacterium]|nr:T9SS type A sorting domain-containing protein [candidate division KSB1 bacterium]